MEEVKERDGTMNDKRGDHRQNFRNFRDISQVMPDVGRFGQSNTNDEFTESTGTNTISYRAEFMSTPVITSSADMS